MRRDEEDSCRLMRQVTVTTELTPEITATQTLWTAPHLFRFRPRSAPSHPQLTATPSNNMTPNYKPTPAPTTNSRQHRSVPHKHRNTHAHQHAKRPTTTTVVTTVHTPAQNDQAQTAVVVPTQTAMLAETARTVTTTNKGIGLLAATTTTARRIEAP